MACGCGKTTPSEAITSAQAEALIAAARAQSLEEQREAAMVSASNAIGNASSNDTALR